jgi:putative ABC transport system permease protein
MKPRWRKVFHDLLDNRSRTLLVVFSIAVGVFSVGVISGAYEILSHDMSASYAANRPANIELRTADFDEDVLELVRNHRDVNQAEGRRVFNLRVRAPGASAWTTLDVVAFEDFEGNSVNTLLPIEGASLPSKRELVLERDALNHVRGARAGELLEFQLPDGSIKTMPVVGIVQDTAMGAGDFLAAPYGYVSWSSLPSLQQPEAFDRIYLTVAQGGDDILHIRAVGAELKDKLEKNGTPVILSRFSKSHEHPLAETINAILGILMALGVLIVFLSSSLIANTLNALLKRHLRHIGVIKLLGGQRRQVWIMYLVLIFSFAMLALLIAVPLGGQGAYGLAAFIAGQMNFNLLGYRIVPLAMGIQVVVGLLVPLVAGLVPVSNGSRITVLRALSGDLARDEPRSAGHRLVPAHHIRLPWFDRMQLRGARLLAKRGIHIPRPLVISLRNTFRHKGRLALTLFTLTMGGAIFIAVFNVRTTLHAYIEQIGKYFVADISLDFDRPYRLSEIRQQALGVDGVVLVEGWQFMSGQLLDPQGQVLENLNIFGPPAASTLVEPNLVAGRWLRPEDKKTFAVSEAVLGYYPNLQPGDLLPVEIDGKEEQWNVAGIFKFVDREGVLAYAPYEYVSRLNNLSNQAYMFRLRTDRHSRSYQDATAERLDTFLRAKGYKVHQSEAGSAALDTAVESLDTLVVFLLIMAVLTAIVGSMGLAGTMGMNVLERTREIGIMRAVGADDRIVMRTVIAEGLVIGMISFVLAILLSVPFTYLLSTIVSLAVFETPIQVVFTVSGYAIWFGLVLALSALGSVVPARSAARLTIREVLAYE